MENAAFPILDEIDRLKVEIDALRPLDPALEKRILDKFRLEWNYHSNALEGNTLSLGETRAFLLEGITAQGKPFKDYLDIKGHDEAIDYLVGFLQNDESLTEVDIRRLHEILLVEPYHVDAKAPNDNIVRRKVEIGRYKQHPNHVETVTGKIHYYATPEETPARMNDLMQWYHEQDDGEGLHPVIVAALFHHRFVEIHPFDDGNGRMARLLTNLILMKRSYPPVLIRKEDRGEYFLALAEADEGDPEGIIDFLARRVYASLDLYLRGAHGEDITALGDFDKRLALLKQRLETGPGIPSEKTAGNQIRVFERIIEPLFRKLGPHLAKIDLFVDHFSHISWRAGRNVTTIEVDNDAADFSALHEVMKDYYVTSLKKIDKWIGMKTRADDSILALIISFDLSDTIVAGTYAVAGREGKLFSGPYDTAFSDADIEAFAVQILDDLYKALEAMSA
jgi:hypothetical protein